MPRGDGTGPAGQGAGTGWNRFNCSPGGRISGLGGVRGGGRGRANLANNNVAGRGGARGVGRGVQLMKQEKSD